VGVYRIKEPIRLRSVPSPHENDRLSCPDRQTVPCTGDDTELEHDNRRRAVFERPSSPSSIAIHPSGKLAYVTNSGTRFIDAQLLGHDSGSESAQHSKSVWTV
jgi:sugar lactone lactonase YvrE